MEPVKRLMLQSYQSDFFYFVMRSTKVGKSDFRAKNQEFDHNINAFEFKKNLTGTIVVQVVIHVGYKYELHLIQCKGCSCNLLMDIGAILRMFPFDDGQFW